MPDIIDRPVIQSGRSIDIFKLGDPALSFVAVLLIKKTAVAL